MAIRKCTMLIQQQTNQSGGPALTRVGGWSESWYIPTEDSLYVRIFTNLCRLRATMLPVGAAVIGQRYQVVDPIGSSTTGSAQFPGSAQIAADMPQASLLCRIGSSDQPNFRPIYFRGLPDARVVEGEYQPSIAFTRAMTAFVDALSAFRFRGRSLNETTVNIQSIDEDGNYQLASALVFVANQQVQVLRTQSEEGNQFGGFFQVESVVSSFAGKLRGWEFGATSKGSIRAKGVVYCRCDPSKFNVSRVVVKKVGRGFFQYRGRASNRR